MAAQNAPSNRLAHPDVVIEELVSTRDFGVIYIADGAGDGTVLNEKPSAAVKNIVKLRGAAIPVLIRHLDDMRLTSAKYKGGVYWDNPIPVPVGYLCLDILSQIVRDSKRLFVQGRRDCDFDGIGACFQSRYYFDPFNYIKDGQSVLPGKQVLVAKHNWEHARERGLLTFRFPAWLERFSAAYSALATPAGGAAKRPCNNAEGRVALDEAGSVRTWSGLYSSYKAYEQCDDGAIGEGYSESVARILLDHWNTLPELVQLAELDADFRVFVTKHIDASLDSAELNKIKSNADAGCPAALRMICSDIAKQADSVLRESTSAP
jgi:hypothetical protein